MKHQQNRSPKFELKLQVTSRLSSIGEKRTRRGGKQWRGRNLAARISRNSAGSPPFVSFVPGSLGIIPASRRDSVLRLRVTIYTDLDKPSSR